MKDKGPQISHSFKSHSARADPVAAWITRFLPHQHWNLPIRWFMAGSLKPTHPSLTWWCMLLQYDLFSSEQDKLMVLAASLCSKVTYWERRSKRFESGMETGWDTGCDWEKRAMQKGPWANALYHNKFISYSSRVRKDIRTFEQGWPTPITFSLS